LKVDKNAGLKRKKEHTWNWQLTKRLENMRIKFKNKNNHEKNN